MTQPHATATYPHPLALIEAASADNLDEVDRLLHAGADVDARNKNGQTALHQAMNVSAAKIRSVLLQSGADIDARDLSNRTSLHREVTSFVPGGEERAGWLLSHGAHVDALDEDGETPLFRAVKWGLHGFCQLLLDRGADIETNNYLRDAVSLRPGHQAG